MPSRPEEIIRGLAEYGPRVAGSEAGSRAVEWARGHLSDLGLETERLSFDCPLWSVDDGPRLFIEGSGEIPCAPMIGSVSGEVSGWLEYHGRMLIWGEKSWTCFRIVGDRRRILAYVLVRPDGEAATQPLPPGAAELPHVVVGASNYSDVETAVRGRQHVSLSLRASTERALGHNVRAWVGEDALDLGGAVLVTAHVDTVPGTPGAYDNAGGVAALLRVAEHVAEGALPSRVQLLLTDAEESHLMGSRAFIESLHGSGRLGNVAGCLNLDGAGRGDVLDVWLDPESLAEYVLPLIGDLDTRFTFPPPQAGDHTAFREQGIPTMMLTFDDKEIIHRAEDVYEHSKLNNALRMADIATDILKCLTQKEVW